MQITITNRPNTDRGYAADTVYTIAVAGSPIFDRPITCYSVKAVIAGLVKLDTQHVHYPAPQDGMLISALAQAGITFH